MSVIEILSVKLQRADQSVSWGFNIQGGEGKPLMIARVNPSSLADRCSMRSGDYVLKIGNIITENLTHAQCRDAIIRQNNHLELTLLRGGIPKHEDYMSVFQFPEHQLMTPANAPNNNTTLSPQVGVQLGPKKAMLSQSYNSPMGLYSSQNIAENLSSAIKSYSGQHAQHNAYEPQLPSRPNMYHPVAPPSPRVAPSNFGSYGQQPQSPRPFSQPVAASAMPPQSRNRAPLVRGGRGSALLKQPNAASNLPTCGACHQLIRGPFVSAVGKIWCPNHFVCAHPAFGMSLQDVGFVEESGKLYCEKDYEAYFAPICHKCQRKIMDECCYALDKAFHMDCFTCGACKQKIGSGKFHLEDGVPYCPRDFAALFSTKCAGCQFPIEAGDKFTEALGQNYHVECFTCSTCNHPLTNGYVTKNNKPYCKKHGTSFR